MKAYTDPSDAEIGPVPPDGVCPWKQCDVIHLVSLFHIAGDLLLRHTSMVVV